MKYAIGRSTLFGKLRPLNRAPKKKHIKLFKPLVFSQLCQTLVIVWSAFGEIWSFAALMFVLRLRILEHKISDSLSLACHNIPQTRPPYLSTPMYFMFHRKDDEG